MWEGCLYLAQLSYPGFDEDVFPCMFQLWDTWSKTGSLFPAVDKRRLQNEIDTHKLFLLTKYCACPIQNYMLCLMLFLAVMFRVREF